MPKPRPAPSHQWYLGRLCRRTKLTRMPKSAPMDHIADLTEDYVGESPDVSWP